MKSLSESKLCESWVHCQTCRDRNGERAWRESVAKCFGLNETDYPCPECLPWGHKDDKAGKTPKPSRAVCLHCQFLPHCDLGRLWVVTPCKAKAKEFDPALLCLIAEGIEE